MPHPHHGPHHGPPHHQWFLSIEEQVTREEFAENLWVLGRELAGGPALEINERTVEVPEEVKFILRYERTPHGSLALVIHAEWDEFAIPPITSIGGLRIGSASPRTEIASQA